MQFVTKRSGLLTTTSMLTTASAAMLGFQPAAQAAIVLDVNTNTGDLQLVGQPGDALSCYIITTADGANAFITQTPGNANYWANNSFTAQCAANTYALGWGEWMTMGTLGNATTWPTLSNGDKGTSQLGEMCAVKATSGKASSDPMDSKVFVFSDQDSAIDLGNEYYLGSGVPVSDILFGYSWQPGFMDSNDSDFWTNQAGLWVAGASATQATWSGSSNPLGNYYVGAGNSWPEQGLYSDAAVDAVPEPASLGLLTLGGTALLARRRQRRA